MNLQRLLPALLALTLVAAPALAQESNPPGDETSPWGIRVGLGADPDQLIGGVNFLETKIAENVYLSPNAELGVDRRTAATSMARPELARGGLERLVAELTGGVPLRGLFGRPHFGLLAGCGRTPD